MPLQEKTNEPTKPRQLLERCNKLSHYKKMLQLSLKKCDVCNRTTLEAALDDYVGKTDKKCEKCNGFYSLMIRFWIDFLRRSLSIKREKVEKLLADPYARRAITTIIRSFNYYGIKKPLSIYAPFLVVWDFTHKCNLSCKHCYSNSGASAQNELPESQGELGGRSSVGHDSERRG